LWLRIEIELEVEKRQDARSGIAADSLGNYGGSILAFLSGNHGEKWVKIYFN